MTATIPLKTAMVCTCCGSTDVRADAWAEWDIDAGEWVLSSTYDNKWCESCEGETRLKEVPFGNCMTSQWTHYETLIISPVRNESDNDNETRWEVCSAENAQMWTIYGLDTDGCSIALHDEADPVDAASALLRLVEALGGASVVYADADRFIPEGSFADLQNRLAEEIHDEIPGYDNIEDFREDDFDNHPLAPLREAIVDLIEARLQAAA